ncbi:MAG: hypothetical protein LBC99_00805 [Spirochaetota bacterium]|jgi:hypothetical protein|nr:hypothetical protein [Spirochaetota bacterium]
MWFGDLDNIPLADMANFAVRETYNFHWTFIAILAFVVYVYATEFKNKNFKGIAAGLALYMVHWFYEIMNAVICAATGYALWTVSAESTSLILLIGVSWELSMMFSIAGVATHKLLPEDPKLKIFGINNRILFAVGNAAFFSLVEIFLASTPAFIWVYPWWGAIPVFITTYIPFFLAAFLVPDAKPKTQWLFIGSLAALNALLLIILVPLGVI